MNECEEKRYYLAGERRRAMGYPCEGDPPDRHDAGILACVISYLRGRSDCLLVTRALQNELKVLHGNARAIPNAIEREHVR